MGLKGFLCRLFGHRYRYNFAHLPNKCICTRCRKKWKADYLHRSLVGDDLWHEVRGFEGEKRTDDELVAEWKVNK